MQNCIVVEHQEGGDWALVLTANRSEYGRRSITPMIFVNDGCGIFAVCPELKAWTRGGLVSLYNPPADRREELLKNAVQEFARQIALRSFIKERSRVGIVARAKARREEFNVAPEGFELSRAAEPAYYWLYERSEAAVQAMRVARYLIEKNHIGALTQEEREALALRLLTRGASLKTLNHFPRR
jgi:hypothetical protein